MLYRDTSIFVAVSILKVTCLPIHYCILTVHLINLRYPAQTFNMFFMFKSVQFYFSHLTFNAILKVYDLLHEIPKLRDNAWLIQSSDKRYIDSVNRILKNVFCSGSNSFSIRVCRLLIAPSIIKSSVSFDSWWV